MAKNPLRDLSACAKAFDLAIDRNTMVEIVLEGLGHAGESAHDERAFLATVINIPMPEYSNPQRAKELLAEAGYPDGFKIDLVLHQ